ncbi:hypothetical protein VTJ83DRAFT_2039 [Remersonia thermophila]|uniref:BHLH domain-containing protein n=1 Tax=Remersonia thermophila TaxID=72144 RepID=A0ABR4DHK7_9PEZI
MTTHAPSITPDRTDMAARSSGSPSGDGGGPGGGGGSGGGRGGGSEERERPRLTDLEKKANHIASEQKRRQAIREGFDRLSEIVPGLQGQARSEGIVLHATLLHLRKLLKERKRLIDILEENGIAVDPELKKPLEMLPPGWLDQELDQESESEESSSGSSSSGESGSDDEGGQGEGDDDDDDGRDRRGSSGAGNDFRNGS